MKYEYYCKELDVRFETSQRMSESAFETLDALVEHMKANKEELPDCPELKKKRIPKHPVHRLISGGAGFQFKF